MALQTQEVWKTRKENQNMWGDGTRFAAPDVFWVRVESPDPGLSNRSIFNPQCFTFADLFPFPLIWYWQTTKMKKKVKLV